MGNNMTAQTFVGGFRPLYHADYEIEWHTVASKSSHIRAGDPVAMESNREVNAVTLSNGAITNGLIYGISAGEGDAGDDIPVYPAKLDTIFVGKTYHDVSATTITWPYVCDLSTTGTATRTSSGTTDITGEMVINADATTEGHIRILGPVNEADDLDDTTNGSLLKFVVERSSYHDLVSAK
jgi:hypothetical protein